MRASLLWTWYPARIMDKNTNTTVLPEEAVILNVTVVHVRFTANDSDFRILVVRGEDSSEFGVKGNFGNVSSGSRLKLYGSWDAPYRGQPQFRCDFFEEIMPSTTEEMLAFLSTGIFPGIGPAVAKKIIDKFGSDAFSILDNDPDRLTEIRGIGEKKKERIRVGWQKQKSAQIIGRFLFEVGVPIRYTERVRRELGDNAAEIIKGNPYRLCDVKGIGFATADKIAIKNGVEKESPFRIAYGIMYALDEACSFGHTYAVYQDLVRTACRILDVGRDLVCSGVTGLCTEGKVIIEDDAVYPRQLYAAETSVAAKLCLLAKSDPFPCNVMPVGEIEEAVGLHYDETQASAIRSAAEESVMVITGGPGTGKSSILSGILTQFERSGLVVKLAAPTGRAAKRMAEVTGDSGASTIHRMLLSLEGEDNDRSPDGIDADVVIIDETSMVDILLMDWLLSYIRPGMRLVLIGDADQLPSVGPGTVLRDIIRSGAFCTVRLTKIYRQDEHSVIAENARLVNNGQRGLIVNRPACGFFFVRVENGAEYIEDRVVDLVTRLLPEKTGYPVDDIQVLSPVKRTDRMAGTSRINKKIRDVVNPLKDGAAEVHGLRVNDRVMNVRNDYSKNVFNGDTGIVSRIDTEDKTVTIDFDGAPVEYDFDELDDSIVLCYAITVHKAQGSEYPVVVMPVTMSHYNMLQRRLFYTAITRARKMIVLVGEAAAVDRAVENASINDRRGRLYMRLISAREEGTAVLPD